MDKYNIGDIYIANNRLFTHIITGANDIGVFSRTYHCDGTLVNENEFINFTCFGNNYKKVSKEEFKSIIQSWQNEETKKYRNRMIDLNRYMGTVLCDAK